MYERLLPGTTVLYYGIQYRPDDQKSAKQAQATFHCVSKRAFGITTFLTGAYEGPEIMSQHRTSGGLEKNCEKAFCSWFNSSKHALTVYMWKPSSPGWKPLEAYFSTYRSFNGSYPKCFILYSSHTLCRFPHLLVDDVGIGHDHSSFPRRGL